jgi:hypothetical protein
MLSMFVTLLTSQSPMGSLKTEASYSAARDGRPCGVSGDLGARGWGTGDDDNTATLEQQHAGWRNTYREHVTHVRHRAHVPMVITDGLIEDRGSLQRSEGRAAVWSEQRSRSEGIGDDDTATQEQRHAGWRNTYTEHGTHVRHRAHVP